MSTPLLLRGDARTLPLADESVDLIVTSPPYFGLRDYGTAGQVGAEPTPQEFLDALLECTAEMVRVLKPSGSIFLNLGDKYGRSGGIDRKQRGTAQGDPGGRAALRLPQRNVSVPDKSLLLLPERYRIRAVDELGLIARAVIVWSKPNGLPESVTDRVRRSHEDFVHLTRLPRYFANVDEIREPTTRGGMTWEQRRARGDAVRQGEQSGTFGDGMAPNPLGKLPGSVWEIATQPLRVPAELGVDHHAAFPMEWPRRLILGWCPPDGVVLDPFGGTGTTALVATMLGRRGISVDLSADYQRIATWRANDPKQRERATQLPKPRPVKPAAEPKLFEHLLTALINARSRAELEAIRTAAAGSTDWAAEHDAVFELQAETLGEVAA